MKNKKSETRMKVKIKNMMKIKKQKIKNSQG